jgi:hypothetical protein
MNIASLQTLARRALLLAAMASFIGMDAGLAANVYYGVNPGAQEFLSANWVDNASTSVAAPTEADLPFINSVDGVTEYAYANSAVAVQRFLIADQTADAGGLEIRSGGAVTTSATGASYVGARGVGHLRLLPGGALNINGPLQVGWGDANGRGIGTVTQSGGTYNGVSAATEIRLGNLAATDVLPASNGTYNMNGGTMLFGGPLIVGHAGVGAFNMSGGAVSISNYIQIARTGVGSLVQTGGTLTAVRATGNAFVIAPFANANGVYQISGGSLKVTSLDDTGGAAIGTLAGDSTALFKVVGNASTITFDNSYVQFPNATLAFEIGTGITPVSVGTTATLDGNLSINFTTTPTVGQQFTIMNYGAGLTGTFAAFDDLVDSPAGANTVKLDIDYGTGSGSAIVLTVDSISSPTIPGDFNLDGDVDAGDLLAWKNNFPLLGGASVGQGDADADADVDGADFLVWQRNYSGPGISAIPEPSAMLLTAAAATPFFGRRRLQSLPKE